ncbi:MAG TPA: tripartite tricarboxylate transporter TctB family protein [Methylomirabilota bacterium]|nr:tripartite tricarboxylate transporter TctB family protein [Methylomirabilota bacterium]
MGAAMALLGVIAVAGALRLPEALIDEGPGTRFLPILLGLVMAILGAAVAFRPGGQARATDADPGRWRRLLATALAIVLYIVLFERLGFLATSTLFLAGLLGAYGERRWPVVGAVAAGATVLTYLVFAVWLKVPLP